MAQNEKLTYTLREARDHISALREEVDKLTQPPSAYGTLLAQNDDGTVDVYSGGRKMRVAVHPALDPDELTRGGEVVLNESLNVVMARSPETNGEVVTVKELLEDGRRAIILGRADEERVAELSEMLVGELVRSGDSVLMDARSGLLLEKLPRPEVEELVLEEVPDISYADIGGLDEQIEQIADAVELPFLHQELFAEHKLPAPKGILLYGPPGCGKTLIAKAVANSLAKKVGARSVDANAKSYFLNIKGPELLNKYVGETERQIRLVFQRAREKSGGGLAGHRVLRRDGLDVPHPRHRHQLRRRVDHRAPAPGRDRRRRVAAQRHRDRRLQPRGPDRPGHPAARPPRREDQDRAAQRDRRGPDLRPLPDRRPAPRRRRGAGDRRRRRRQVRPGDDRAHGRRDVPHRPGERVPRGHLPER